MKTDHLHEKAIAVFLVITLVLSVLAFAPAATAASSGRTLTVSHIYDPGDDTDSDTSFHTIQAAIDDANAGDRIEIKNGTYHESVVVHTEVSIVGDGADDTVLIGNGTTTMQVGTDNVEVTGLTIKSPGEESDEPALTVWDSQHPDSHAIDISIHDNVFVGDGGTKVLVGIGEPWGPSQARNIEVVDNEFRGGELDQWSGWYDTNTSGVNSFSMSQPFQTDEMGIALWAGSRESTYRNNHFDVKVKFAAVKVAGPHNTFENTQIDYPGDSWSGFAIGPDGFDTTVNGLSVDGHPDQHQHTNDPTYFGVYVAGSGSTLTDVESMDSHIGVQVGTSYFGLLANTEGTFSVQEGHEGGPSNVTFNDLRTTGNDNFDLRTGPGSDHVTVNGMMAQSTLRPASDLVHMWWEHETGVNVYAKGYGHTFNDVRSTNSAPIGMRIEADDTMVNQAQIENKGGGGNWMTTGIVVANADGSTIQHSLISNNDVGVHVSDSDSVSLLHNNPSNETNAGIVNNAQEGVILDSSDDATLRDNHIALNDLGMRVVDSVDVRALYNNFVNNAGGQTETAGQGILALDGSDVDATWNWWGATNGPGGGATDGALTGDGDAIDTDGNSDIWYDPFLTAPKDEVQQDPDKTVQYGHDLVMAGSQGLQSIGVPGPADLQFQTSPNADAAVWQYDAGGDSFAQLMNAQPTASHLDAYIVSGLDHNEHIRAVIDFSDTQPAQPGDAQLSEGWNFVASPQYGPAEDAIRATADIKRVEQIYDQAESQPMPHNANPKQGVFSYPMGSDSPGPNLSAYSGYWMYVTDSGTVSAVVPSGVTLREEPDLLTTHS